MSSVCPQFICRLCKEPGHLVKNCRLYSFISTAGPPPPEIEDKTTKETDSMKEIRALQNTICIHCKDPGHMKKNCPKLSKDIQNKRGENFKVIF